MCTARRRRSGLGTASVLLGLALGSAHAPGQTMDARAAPPAAAAAPAALSPQVLFLRVAPSIFVIHTFDSEGGLLAQGSAVALSADTVVTNNHVVKDGFSFRLEQRGKFWPATVTHCDSVHDLCLLQVPGLQARPAQVRDSTPAQAGERVYAVGAPLGLDLTISDGIISGMRQLDGHAVIQTSAAISPGSSGGGLFDSQARLLGITEAGMTSGQSLNFAVPIDALVALRAAATSNAPPAPKSDPGSRASHAALALTAVHQVCVGPLGDSIEAKSAQHLLVTALVQSQAVGVTENCAQADAEIQGLLDVTPANETQSYTEHDFPYWDQSAVSQTQRLVPHASATLEASLVDHSGHVIWADAEQSNGSLSSGAVPDAVTRVARRLLIALRAGLAPAVPHP